MNLHLRFLALIVLLLTGCAGTTKTPNMPDPNGSVQASQYGQFPEGAIPGDVVAQDIADVGDALKAAGGTFPPGSAGANDFAQAGQEFQNGAAPLMQLLQNLANANASQYEQRQLQAQLAFRKIADLLAKHAAFKALEDLFRRWSEQVFMLMAFAKGGAHFEHVQLQAVQAWVAQVPSNRSILGVVFRLYKNIFAGCNVPIHTFASTNQTTGAYSSAVPQGMNPPAALNGMIGQRLGYACAQPPQGGQGQQGQPPVFKLIKIYRTAKVSTPTGPAYWKNDAFLVLDFPGLAAKYKSPWKVIPSAPAAYTFY